MPSIKIGIEKSTNVARSDEKNSEIFLSGIASYAKRKIGFPNKGMAAINMPVQGTSADIIKVAMVNLHREMLGQKLKSKMILQVHDELVFEVPEDEVKMLQKLVPDIMSTAIKLDVPLKVDLKIGKNWEEMG